MESLDLARPTTEQNSRNKRLCQQLPTFKIRPSTFRIGFFSGKRETFLFRRNFASKQTKTTAERSQKERRRRFPAFRTLTGGLGAIQDLCRDHLIQCGFCENVWSKVVHVFTVHGID